jgi:hypothetical protein
VRRRRRLRTRPVRARVAGLTGITGLLRHHDHHRAVRAGASRWWVRPPTAARAGDGCSPGTHGSERPRRLPWCWSQGTNWQLGAGLLLVANVSLACSLVVNDAILCDVAGTLTSATGSRRAPGLRYLGGGLLSHPSWRSWSTPSSRAACPRVGPVRLCLAGAGLWWAGFTVIPYRGCATGPPRAVPDAHAAPQGAWSGRASTSWPRPCATPATTPWR